MNTPTTNPNTTTEGGRWKRGSIIVAMPDGPMTVEGWVLNGVGLHASMFGTEPSPTWMTLTHLKTGHGIAQLEGPFIRAKAPARRVALCCDWSFDKLPRAGTRILAALRSKVEAALFGECALIGTGTGERSHKIARAVASTVSA